MTYFSDRLATTSSNLLLVDEDPFIARILRQTLQPEFNVMHVANAIEAMNWMDQGNTPELIITELNISNLDGRKFIQLVRDSNLLGHLPIIVLSAKDDSTTRVECLEDGADAFLVKPFNPFEVKAKARAILRRTSVARSGPIKYKGLN
jgi:DNA-binding response OmpR family regulator